MLTNEQVHEAIRIGNLMAKYAMDRVGPPQGNTVTPGNTVPPSIENQELHARMLSKSPSGRDVTTRVLGAYGWRLKTLCTYFIDLAKAKNMKSAEFYKERLLEGFCMLCDVAHFFGFSILEILDSVKDSEGGP